MRKLLLLFAAALLCISATKQKTIKIACLGDSITHGYGIGNRAYNSYPYQLGEMLGDRYEVENYGVSGATMLSEPYANYRRNTQFQDIIDSQPDIIFLCLGTNDASERYKHLVSNFENDYKMMIRDLKDEIPGVRIILLLPPKIHAPSYEASLQTNVIPVIKKIAFEKKLELIDLNHLFADYDKTFMPDRLHPSALGAAFISQRLYNHLTLETEKFDFDTQDIKPTSFHGFDCYTFEFKGRQAHVVKPKAVAKDRPWIWRARFWNNPNASVGVDIAMLERGFHLVYTDVVDMFGSPKAVKQFEGFYDYLTKGGLNKKCVLEGMSRGGLMVYNFAVDNPEKVAAVYADAPFLNFNIFEDANRKVNVKDKLFAAYKFKTVKDALEYENTPIKNAEYLAEGGFAMIHVCGTADESVPLKDNTLLFKEKVEKAGGKIIYIEKKDVGHHPHGLENYEPIVKHILIATGQYPSPTTVPTPGAEFRTGWDWQTIHEDLVQTNTVKQHDILFLGNSITQGFGGPRKCVKYKPGEAILNKAFAGHTWANAGINGDRTEHLLYRILNDDYAKCDPKYVVMNIGINNLATADHEPENIVDGIIKCVEAVCEKIPNAKVILFSTLPADRAMDKCLAIFDGLSAYDFDPQVTLVDPYPVFAPTKKVVEAELYGPDKLHLSVKGYEAWVELMKKYIVF